MARKKLRSLSEYLTVAKAASLLGVSKSTLRNWDRTGKLRTARHPVNKHRLYCREELERLPKFSEYLTVGKAAALLGISKSTLRNWDLTGKLRIARHPVNKHRLYCRDKLEGFLR